MTVDVRLEDGHRQMILMALGELAVARPGWVWALGDLADRLNGRFEFDRFRELAALGPLMMATDPDRVEKFRGAVAWLKSIAETFAPAAAIVGDDADPTDAERVQAASHGHAVYLLEALGQVETATAEQDWLLLEVAAFLTMIVKGRTVEQRAREAAELLDKIGARLSARAGEMTEPGAGATLVSAELAMRHGKATPDNT